MKNEKVLFFLILVVVLHGHSQFLSPQLPGSAGESHTNAVYSLDWSIGEVITETYNSNSQYLSQGFHQGRYDITGVSEYYAIADQVTVYPNPVENFLNISAKGVNTTLCWCYLMDNNGILLAKSPLEEYLQLLMTHYAAGTYNLLIQYNDQTIKIFKIIKNQ